MTSVKVHFNLSAKGRQSVFESTGNWPAEQQELAADAADLSEEQRKLLLAHSGTAWVTPPRWNDGFIVHLRDYDGAKPGSPDFRDGSISADVVLASLDTAPSWDEVFVMLAGMAERKERWLERTSADVERLRIANEQRMAQYEADRAADRAKEDERDRKKAAEQAAVESKKASIAAERLAWAMTHGSDRLRRGLERGHDCGRLYVIERAGVEAPGYVLDYEDAAAWKPRSCPSTGALDEADRVQALGLGLVEIVWLTEGPRAEKATEYEEHYESFEPCEAVVVREYLDRYDLVKIIS